MHRKYYLEGLFVGLPIQEDGLTQEQRAVCQHIELERVVRTAVHNAVSDAPENIKDHHPEGCFTGLPIQDDGLTQKQRAIRQHLDFQRLVRTALLNAVSDRSTSMPRPGARHHGNTLAKLQRIAKVREAPPRVGQPVPRGRTSPREPAPSAAQENRRPPTTTRGRRDDRHSHAKDTEPLGWHKRAIVGVVAALGLTLTYAYIWALPIAVRQHKYHAEHGNGAQAQMPQRLKVAWARAAHGLEPGPTPP